MISEVRGRILIAEDDVALSKGLQDVLESEGYKITVAKDGYQALERIKKAGFDLVLSDIKMPRASGLEVLRGVKENAPEIPVIMMTGFASMETAIEATRRGAYDYVTKPFDIDKLKLVIKRAINERNLSLENRELERDLQASQMAMISTLVATIEAKSKYMHGHSERVASISFRIARDMNLPDVQQERLKHACTLHDIGKLAIADRILDKPGKLSEEEWAEIRLHPARGAELLASLEFLKDVNPLVRHHHERFDGKGYPDGLRGEAIPLAARIITISDSFDAMISKRPYRKTLTLEETKKDIKANLGTQFDPEIGKIFLAGL